MARFIAILLLGVVLLGLSRPGLSLTAMEQVARATNDFAMDLYWQIRSDPDVENMFFSPFSVSSALGMVYVGARGNTRTEMGDVLKIGHIRDTRVNRGFRRLFEVFNDPTNKYTLSVANALFGRVGYPFLRRYRDIISRSYFAKLKSVDFERNPMSSCRFINDWVANNTNEKIKNVLSPEHISTDTIAILVNTIYFKGMWKTKFHVKNTVSRTFHLTPETHVTTKMMHIRAQKFNYAEVSSLSCKILELPYVGDEVSMYILLPNSIDGLAELESQLTSAELDNAISMTKYRKVDISIPKFSMMLKVELTELLKEMGMRNVFGNADLSGIDGTHSMYVSSVVHKAYIGVNEKGTEAAAATSVGTARSFIVPRKLFKANHPFLFFIREKVTGSILFSGRFLKPPQAETGSGSSGTGRVTTTPETGNNSNSSEIGSQEYPPCCRTLPDWVCEVFQQHFGDDWCNGRL